jgi:hypothetical protein
MDISLGISSEISRITCGIPGNKIPVAKKAITLKDIHPILLQANEATYDGNRSSLSDDS